jgi:hypothetical protein
LAGKSGNGITLLPSVSVADNALIAVAPAVTEYLLWLHHLLGVVTYWNGNIAGLASTAPVLSVAVKVKVVVPVKVPFDQS